jgi:hypothetical protein
MQVVLCLPNVAFLDDVLVVIDDAVSARLSTQIQSTVFHEPTMASASLVVVDLQRQQRCHAGTEVALQHQGWRRVGDRVRAFLRMAPSLNFAELPLYAQSAEVTLIWAATREHAVAYCASVALVALFIGPSLRPVRMVAGYRKYCGGSRRGWEHDDLR